VTLQEQEKKNVTKYFSTVAVKDLNEQAKTRLQSDYKKKIQSLKTKAQTIKTFLDNEISFMDVDHEKNSIKEINRNLEKIKKFSGDPPNPA